MSDLTSQYIIAQKEHDYNEKYEEGTIVKHTIDDVTTAYIAKKSVPRFTSILNENYWKKIASTTISGESVDIFDEDVEATDTQRNKALANVSNQTANSSTGKIGYKVLDPTKTFAEQVTAENTIYEIRDVFDLGGTQETPVSVTLPAGSTLKFNGGAIKNCTIVGNNTALEGTMDITTSFSGTFTLKKDVSPVDFGLKLNDDTINASPYLAKCFELANVSNVGIHIPKGTMYVMNSIDVSSYTTLSIKGEGRKSVIGVYYDFFESSRSVETVANISDFCITKVNRKGDGYYKGIAFKNFEFTASEINNLYVKYFGIFIKGGLHVNTVIENCNLTGLGYSFLTGCACEDFENDTLFDSQVSMDSSIRNNYINCAVRGNTSSPLPNNRSLIYGNFTSSRFESNFCDYWKCIFDLYSYSSAGRFKGNIIANNFFDRIFSLCIHQINSSRISLVSNQFFECKKSDNLSGNWSYTVDPDVINSTAWIMMNLSGANIDDFQIKDNLFDCDIVATISSSGSSNFKDVVTEHNVREKIIYFPTSSNINSANVSEDEFILYNKKLYSKTDPKVNFELPYKYVANTNNTFNAVFGEGFYDFKKTMPQLGWYAYDFIKFNPKFIGKAKASNDYFYAYRNIGGTDRLVLQTINGKIKGIESKDLIDIRNNIESEELTFETAVTILDKRISITRITSSPVCYTMHEASKNIGNNAVSLIVSSLPNSYLIINRVVLNITDNKWYRYTYDGWVEDAGTVPIKSVGTTAERPQEWWRYVGTEYRDTDLNADIIWNGEKWIYKDSGYDAVVKIGTTQDRPVFTQDTNVGFEYYDSDLDKKIMWNGTDWINLDGTALS